VGKLPRSDTEVRPFSDELIPQAAALLAARQARLRAIDPTLPARLESPAAAQQSLTSLCARPRAAGVAALDGNRLMAYMIGAPRPEPVWGRNAWVHSTALALADGVDPSLIPDLYARLGEAWVRDGIFFHFALTPVAEPEIVQTWFALGFGIEQVHALADLRAVEPPPPLPAGMTIRRAGAQDAQTLAGFSELIWRQLLKPPVWAVSLPESASQTRRGYAELATDPTATVWLAEVNGHVVAIQGYWEHDDPDPVLVPEKAVTLSVLSTLPGERRKGYQAVLTRHGLWQTRLAGYDFCETDWRSANPGVAHMLPRLGFRPLAYRLVRRVDARIAWARSAASPPPPETC
jgi:hypothetical protein